MDIIKVTEKLNHTQTAQATLTLPFELRQKSRLRATLDNGDEVGLILERGQVLRHGTQLRSENGLIIEVHAAPESVSTFYSNDPLLLARACYHLGNRHLPLQIANGWCRYQHDHVLDDMVRSLGLEVKHETAPFEPEAGAYDHSHDSQSTHPHTDHNHHKHHHSHSHQHD